MSGLEALSALTSVAQLLVYAISIPPKVNEFRSRIRNAPRKLEQYERQLKELAVLAGHIDQNPALQSDEVKIHLNAIVATAAAIEDTLARYKRSSRTRQNWKIMSGDLSRKLEEYFGDVKKRADILSLLIISTNAYEQQELKKFIQGPAGMAPAFAPAPAATDPSICNQDILSKAEILDRRYGSSSFHGLKISRNGSVNIGNTSHHTDVNSAQGRMAGHLYANLTVSENKIIHFGNTGGYSEGHITIGGEMNENDVVVIGDYRTLDLKHQDIQHQRVVSTAHARDKDPESKGDQSREMENTGDQSQGLEAPEQA